MPKATKSRRDQCAEIIIATLDPSQTWNMISVPDTIALCRNHGFAPRTTKAVLSNWLIQHSTHIAPIRVSERMATFNAKRPQRYLNNYLTEPLPGIISHIKIHLNVIPAITPEP